MANLAFTTNGALPKTQQSLSALSPGLGTGTPQSKALNNSANAGAISKVQLPSVPSATTPVKSTSITQPDGTSHVTTYHAPPAPATASVSQEKPAAQSAPQGGGYSTVEGPYDPVTGLLKSGQSGQVPAPQATGTQHPGDAGFNTSLPVNHQTGTAQAQYDSSGKYAGTVGGTTGNPAPAQPQAGPNTFPGLIGSLSSAAQNGSQAGQKYTQQTADYGAGNIDIGKSAAQIASEYGQKIADVGQQGAQFRAGQLTTGTSPVAVGNAAITAQTTADQQKALATGEEAALQGTAQQLTGQGQAATAANAAAGQANTAQGLQQSGFQQAGSLAQPSPAAQGQTTFNPLTGKFEGGSYQTNLQTVVNAIKSGNMGYTDGVNSLSGLSPTAKADVLAALGPNFDAVAADAAAAAKGSNITTGGTAATGANAQGLAQSIQQETTLQTAAQNAQALAAQVGDAIKNAGLNLTNSTDANTALNNLQSRLGNAAYTQLNIAVNDARSQYASILQSTGAATPTEAGNMANQNISANMSPKQILAAIDQLNAGVKARQDAAHAQTTQYQSQLSGSNPSRTPSSSTGGGVVQTKAGAVNTNW